MSPRHVPGVLSTPHIPGELSPAAVLRLCAGGHACRASAWLQSRGQRRRPSRWEGQDLTREQPVVQGGPLGSSLAAFSRTTGASQWADVVLACIFILLLLPRLILRGCTWG